MPLNPILRSRVLNLQFWAHAIANYIPTIEVL